MLDKDLSRVISEFHFRSAFLLTPPPSQLPGEKFEALGKSDIGDASGKCFAAMSVLSGLFDKLLQAAGQVDVPIFTQVLKIIIGVPTSGVKLAEASVATALQLGLHGANLGAHALEETFKILFSYTDILPDVVIAGPFSAIEKALDAAVNCFATASKTEEQFSVATCGVYADVFRGVVDEVAAKPIETPADASEDLKRALAGAQAMVNLSKNSIAPANDDLLNTRPIFVGNVLDQYRDEVNRLATTDDIKNFAQLKLSSVVAASNALEACLYIAADPGAAAEEFNEELDAFEDEDEADEYY